MALETQSVGQPTWRWPQQLPQEFMMNTQGFTSYDSRTAAPAPLQRPMVTPQYGYGPTYSSAHMPQVPSPHYQHHHYAFQPYPSPPPSTTAMSSPAKEAFVQRQLDQTMMPNGSPARALTYSSDSKPMLESQYPSHGGRSNSIVSDAGSATSASSGQNSKTVSLNETINPADQVQFNTGVDELMKVLQNDKAAKQDETGHLTPAQSPKLVASSPACSPANAISPSPAAKSRKDKEKKYVCDGPNCNKAFVQKTHMEIHKRTHTGVRPYQCEHPGCGLTFTQRGNLRTHQRRHLNERPYKCDQCGKGFAQRGNLRSHEETHKGLKPYACRLDGCSKTFSQLGNMKTHQNNFHKETLQHLTTLFVQLMRDGEVPKEQRELLEYFQQHYKNSNKGIKGRGKGRVVSTREKKPTTKANRVEPGSAPFPQPPQMQQHHQHQDFQTDLRMPAYTVVPGPTGMMDNSIPRSHQSHMPCGMFDPTHGHHPQTTGIWYEDQQRPMSFADRLY